MDYQNNSLYSKIIEITSDYLGPASKRFIDRQIINHLDKSPEKITHRDLESLIEWISSATALITEDKHLIEEYTGRLTSLTKKEVVR